MPSQRLQHYWTPTWWTAPFGYISFLLLYPSFDGYPFNRLAHIPPLDKVEDKYKLNSTLIESWQRLERKLVIACTLLVREYPTTVVWPFYPSAWGYAVPHSRYAFAHRRAIIARDWFVIFMTGLSFLIAMGDSERVWKSGNIPDWFARLHKAGCEQVWLAGVAASQVGTFSPSVARVELFINFINKEVSQPDPEWFCAFHVPVCTCGAIMMSCKCMKKGFPTSYPHPTNHRW
jgi:hypothetical protein